MAESDPEPEISSDSLSLRHLSNSFFSIPGYLVGFGSKGLSDFDSIRSPTSPLDIGVFTNFRKPKSLRFARSSSERGRKKELNSNGVVGLGIVNSLVDDASSEIPNTPNSKKNIIFGPQVRTNAGDFLRICRGSLDSSLRSKSLPTNYVSSRLSQTKCLNPQSSIENLAFDNEEEIPSENNDPVLCFSASNAPSSLASSESVEVENSLETKLSTVPIPIIGPSQGFVGSLSAREIELSEDYTCIISHGPNPKTIHIFGDCVLECHVTESNNFGDDEESGKNSALSNSVQPDEVLIFCFACKKKFEEAEEVYMNRGNKAFCSFDCYSGNISEDEDETEIADQKSSGSSSSFHEDVFLLGMPVAM